MNACVAAHLLEPFAVGAPDLGIEFESTLRAGPSGNLLMALNLTDWPQTRTADLTACVESGQPTLRYRAAAYGFGAIATIASGTTTDTVTFAEGETAYYMCPLNAAAEYAPPIVAVHQPITDDVPNAAKVAVRFAYNPNLLGVRTDSVVDCSTGGPCTLPVDLKIGPVYYNLVYLSASGALLRTSDTQVLHN